MSAILEYINDYSQIELASKVRFFTDTKSAIYMWYFPIQFNTTSSNINRAHNFFYENDLAIYDRATRLVIEDHRRKLRGVISLFNPDNSSQIQLKEKAPIETDKRVADLLLSMSTFANPIYIGKATRGGTVKDRLKEHLNRKSTFGRSLNENLSETNYTLNDLIVRVIDVELLVQEKFNGCFEDSFDFAEYLERILINLFKPVYNIRN